MADLTGKVILITGATSGIGRHTAIAAAKAGAKVAFTGRREDRGQELESEITNAGGEALYIKADATSEADTKRAVDQTVAKFGALHGAVNNAGYEGQFAPAQDFTEDNYRKVFDVNVLGVHLSLKHEIPALLASGGGSIVNTSSIAGLIGLPGGSVYIGSKHAVNGITKSVALEVVQQNIRVNAICPAGVDTDMFDRFTGNDEGKAAFAAQHPIGRVGTTDEISNLILWLLSDESTFVTGQAIAADGGWTAR